MLATPSSQLAKLSNDVLACRMSSTSAGGTLFQSFGSPGTLWSTNISDSRWGSGTGFHSIASATLKMAVVAPIPSASVRMAVAVKPGALRKLLAPKRISFHNPMKTRYVTARERFRQLGGWPRGRPGRRYSCFSSSNVIVPMVIGIRT